MSQTPLMGLKRRSELDIVGAAEGVPMCGSFCGAGDIPAAVALARKAEVATNSNTNAPSAEGGPMSAPAAAVAALSTGEILMQTEHDCALARERADSLREAMAHLAKAVEIATR